MASNNIARLGVVLGLDSAEFQQGVDKAIAENKKLKAAIQRESNAAAKEIVALKYATEDYGKSLTQVERLQREFSAGGKYARATQELKDQLLAQAAAYDKKAAAEQRAYMSGSKLFQMTTQQRAALAYQTTDIITGLASGQNPLIVLIQQGGQLRDQFGGFIPLFKGIAQAFTLTRVAIGGLATAFAAVGIAAFKGASELDTFNKSLVLTNNYAGITIDRYKQLSEEIGSRFNISIGSARDILGALVSSGKFTEPTMAAVANVIARVAKLTGETAETVAKDLIPSFNGTAASAASLNERFNFLNLAQYRQIELLASQGKTQEAAQLTAELLTKSLEKQVTQVNYLSQAFSELKKSISDAFQAFSDMFMPETNLQRMQRFAKEAEDLVRKFGADPSKRTAEQSAAIGGKILEYLGAYRIVAQEQDKLNEETLEKQKNREQIQNETAAGGLKKRQQLELEYAKITNDALFQAAVYKANEFERIYLEGNKKAADAAAEYERNNLEERGVNQVMRARILSKQIEAINLETAQKIEEISRKEAEVVKDRQLTNLDAVKTEEQRLQLYKDNLLMTESELKIAMSRLATEQEIDKILRNQKLTEEAKAEAVGRQREIQERRESVIRLGDDLKVLQDVNRSVFSNMEQAIDNFVRTGKLSFKSLAQSIIQDILAIYLKSQLLAMFRTSGIGSLFSFGGGGAGGMGGYTGPSVSTVGFAAEGGDINGPTIVGEKGPELFIPRNAGTVIPNHKLNDVMGGNTYVTNNYIDAIDVKSFEDRILGSSNAVWAANKYADKSLAVSRGRT